MEYNKTKMDCFEKCTFILMEIFCCFEDEYYIDDSSCSEEDSLLEKISLEKDSLESGHLKWDIPIEDDDYNIVEN